MDAINRKEFLKRLAIVSAGGMFISFSGCGKSSEKMANKLGTDYFVDSINGNDGNKGITRDAAGKTWKK